MPRNREQASRDAQLWAACRVIVMHQDGGTCGQCDPSGCRLYVWADTLLRDWEAERGRPYAAEPAPAWGPRVEAGALRRSREP